MQKKDTRKRRKPPTKTKSSGVHTCYLGEPTAPLLAGLEAYCMHKERTVSEAIRDCITFALLDKGLIEDTTGLLTPEKYINAGKLSKRAAKIVLTEKGKEYRKLAVEKANRD